MDNPFIKQIRVGPHSVSDIMILQTFRNLAEVVHDVEDPKEEMARLARSIEETQILQQKKFIAKVNVPCVRISRLRTWLFVCYMLWLLYHQYGNKGQYRFMDCRGCVL